MWHDAKPDIAARHVRQFLATVPPDTMRPRAAAAVALGWPRQSADMCARFVLPVGEQMAIVVRPDAPRHVLVVTGDDAPQCTATLTSARPPLTHRPAFADPWPDAAVWLPNMVAGDGWPLYIFVGALRIVTLVHGDVRAALLAPERARLQQLRVNEHVEWLTYNIIMEGVLRVVMPRPE